MRISGTNLMSKIPFIKTNSGRTFNFVIACELNIHISNTEEESCFQSLSAYIKTRLVRLLSHLFLLRYSQIPPPTVKDYYNPKAVQLVIDFVFAKLCSISS